LYILPSWHVLRIVYYITAKLVFWKLKFFDSKKTQTHHLGFLIDRLK
jgi:hypothetical protein